MTLEQIRAGADRNAYPVDFLDGHETALVLFASGFMGRQDAIWMYEAGLETTCVDRDEEALAAMRDVYPAGWSFEASDAFEYAAAARVFGNGWDVVSIDCPTDLFDRCGAEIATWCAIANRVVVLGTGPQTEIGKYPVEWEASHMQPRSRYAGGTYWMAFERLP